MFGNELLPEVHITARGMFMQYGAPPRCILPDKHWTGRRGPVEWVPWSPDLNPTSGLILLGCLQCMNVLRKA
jgi:hypothetical protein